MQIKLDEEFEANFEIIFRYISQDKMSAAKEFKKNLFKQIIIYLFSHINIDSQYILKTKI